MYFSNFSLKSTYEVGYHAVGDIPSGVTVDVTLSVENFVGAKSNATVSVKQLSL